MKFALRRKFEAGATTSQLALKRVESIIATKHQDESQHMFFNAYSIFQKAPRHPQRGVSVQMTGMAAA